jgi:hypothetical protein
MNVMKKLFEFSKLFFNTNEKVIMLFNVFKKKGKNKPSPIDRAVKWAGPGP